MNRNMSVIIELEGKQGKFNKKLDLTLFRMHTTKSELDTQIPAIIKEIRSMLKQSDYCGVVINILSMNEHYRRFDEYRYIIQQGWNHPTLDSRKFDDTNREYPQNDVVTYDTERTLFKNFNQAFERQVRYILGDIPQERSFYQQELDERNNQEQEVSINEA